MSQFFIATTANNLPPNVPTTFQAIGDGTATPALNTINFAATVTSANTSNGFVVNATGSTVTYTVTNTIIGSATTTDNVTPVQLFNFPLGTTPGVYNFLFKTVAFNVTDGTGAVYQQSFGRRTDGANVFSFGDFDLFENEEGTMQNVLLVIGSSGNAIKFTATGLLGKTIHWSAIGTYLFVS